MAEAENNGSTGGSNEASGSSNWWGGWLQAAVNKSVDVLDTVCKDVNELAHTAKVKSVEVYDYVKKDIGEFTQTVQEEVTSTASALKQKLNIEETGGAAAATVKRSLTSFINTVSDAFYIPPEDDDEPIFVDRLQAIIYTMGCDPVTFLVDPDSEEYAAWNKSMSLETHQQDIDLLLSGNEKLVKNRENLVPSQVSELDFWSRYLFRIHAETELDVQRKLVMSKPDSQRQPNDETAWEAPAEEIPEELQAKLLSDYEKERKETLRCRDKDDMVLVSRPGETDSPSKESSNEEEWEVPAKNSPK